jgi:hypothetical protein
MEGATMFNKFTMLGLLITSAVLMLGIEANAGCINLAGGGQFCADWLTGSQTCSVRLVTGGIPTKGTGSVLDCSNGNCEVTCTASGTEKGKTSTKAAQQSKGKSCTPGNENCGIQAYAFCDAASSVVRQRLTVAPDNTDLLLPTQARMAGQMRARGQITGQECKPKKHGGSICQTSLNVEPEECKNCCQQGNFVSFTAQKFLAEAKICPSQNQDGKCISIIEQCSMNPNNIQPGKTNVYRCKLVQGDGGTK